MKGFHWNFQLNSIFILFIFFSFFISFFDRCGEAVCRTHYGAEMKLNQYAVPDDNGADCKVCDDCFLVHQRRKMKTSGNFFFFFFFFFFFSIFLSHILRSSQRVKMDLKMTKSSSSCLSCRPAWRSRQKFLWMCRAVCFCNQLWLTSARFSSTSTSSGRPCSAPMIPPSKRNTCCQKSRGLTKCWRRCLSTRESSKSSSPWFQPRSSRVTFTSAWFWSRTSRVGQAPRRSISFDLEKRA